MTKKEITVTKQIAEEAIYSAKGHFKTGDWIERELFLLIFVPAITSLLVLVFNFSDLINKIASSIGFLFSVLALSYPYTANQKKANQDVKQHMDLGNKYLEIYKKMRMGSQLGSIGSKELKEATSEISKLDKKSQDLRIKAFARWHTKISIKTEVDLSWLG